MHLLFPVYLGIFWNIQTFEKWMKLRMIKLPHLMPYFHICILEMQKWTYNWYTLGMISNCSVFIATFDNYLASFCKAIWSSGFVVRIPSTLSLGDPKCKFTVLKTLPLNIYHNHIRIWMIKQVENTRRNRPRTLYNSCTWMSAN